LENKVGRFQGGGGTERGIGTGIGKLREKRGPKEGKLSKKKSVKAKYEESTAMTSRFVGGRWFTKGVQCLERKEGKETKQPRNRKKTIQKQRENKKKKNHGLLK